ncbi:MAG TPA: hypothetical protein VFX47_05600 [Gammaproteobacteria bacterium]|nr:hypothetical protein [Gammaproteobacteria bacterium]
MKDEKPVQKPPVLKPHHSQFSKQQRRTFDDVMKKLLDKPAQSPSNRAN